jgi:hypothetical protein
LIIVHDFFLAEAARDTSFVEEVQSQFMGMDRGFGMACD